MKAAGVNMAFGTYQDALRMVGTRTEPRFAGTAVSAARIQLFAAMVRDANSSYWDPDFAAQQWGGLVAPPAMLMSWLIPPPWTPGEQTPTAAIALRVPLPGTSIINAANDADYLVPIREGDRLSVVEEVVAVSPEKRARYGTGHFIDIRDEFRRQDGTLVAVNRNTLLRFTPDGRP